MLKQVSASMLIDEKLLEPRGKEAAMVTEEQWKYIDKTIVDVLREELITREIFPPVGPLGLGTQAIAFDVLADMAEAIIGYIFTETGEDVINLSRTSLNIPILHKEFKIHRRDLVSSQRTGTPLDVSVPAAAAAKVAELENVLCIKGDKRYGIKGLYDSAGLTEATADDFGTFGNATDKFKKAIALLAKEKVYPPYNVILHPTQHSELMGSLSSTGVSELIHVEKMLRGGNIYMTLALDDGTGIMCGKKPQYFDLVIGQDVKTEMKETKVGDVFGMTFETVVPRIKQANAICKLTNI